MAVYIDNAQIKYGEMRMSHMAADTLEELHEMADKIGVSRRWFQGDHYDVCATKRAKAIHFGALSVRSKDIVIKLKAAGLR